MQFTEKETELLKTWIIKKLEDISDADADVLADYALALVSTEDAVEVARANCIDNLKDFLPNNAELFVDELFQTIATKSYDPNAPPPPRPAEPVSQVPSGPKHGYAGPMSESRKRSLQWDQDEGFGLNGQFQGGNRPIKQMRRGGRGGFDRGGRQQHGPMGGAYGAPPFPQGPNMAQGPSLPNELPPWDPNNPLPAMMAMQQMLGAMPGFPNAGSPQNGAPFRPPGAALRCRDYDTKGFCGAGVSCPYEHGNDGYMIPPQSHEYDPSNAFLPITPNRTGNFNAFDSRGRGGQRGRGRGRGANASRGGGVRSDFSQLGPSRDSSNTSIVVEQIPEDKLDEQSVRAFFSEFGAIEEVTMHPDRQLAIVKYASKPAARAAYDSPRVVFDNRFVKVYWFKSEMFDQQHSSTPAAPNGYQSHDIKMEDDEPAFDTAELAKRQEEAQRKHEEAKKQREEAEKQKASLDQKLKAMEAERKKMADLLAKKSAKAASPDGGSSPIVTCEKDEESEQTKSLKAHLAKLEAEAKSLGIDPDAPHTNGFESYSGSPYRGRGGYRGRGRGRGGFHQPYRGGWAGGGATRGGAVMRLDNRPKTIAVTFTSGVYDANDEALRQFLLFNSMETAAIAKHPEKDDTALITFNQRYEGENFMQAAARAEIPHAGKVEASWHHGQLAGLKMNGNGMGKQEEGDVKMESEGDAGDREMYEREELDLDRYA